MAYIEKRGSSYRAIIRKKGTPQVTKTFSTEEEARYWAKEVEGALVREQSLSRDFWKDLAKKFITDSAVAYPKISGVYFLIDQDEVVYVGMTTHVLRRLSEHECDGKKFTAYFYIECNIERAKELEAHYIQRLKPSLNLRADCTPVVPKRQDPALEEAFSPEKLRKRERKQWHVARAREGASADRTTGVPFLGTRKQIVGDENGVKTES